MQSDKQKTSELAEKTKLSPPPVTEGEDPMVTLCRFVVETNYEALPANLVEFAKKHILDTVGITIGGSGEEGIATIVGLVKEQGGKEESYIPCYGGRVPASSAGLAIGPMSRALDMGDVHLEAGGHTSEYVLPTLLGAIGLKDRVSGKEFITAFVVGQEVLVRVASGSGQFKQVPVFGEAIDQGGFYIFGAVAAVAKLLGLSHEQTVNAMGLAKCMTQTHDMAMYTPATLAVRAHHGFLARDAITACLLAKRGITGPRNILLGKKGFFNVFSKGRWEADPERVTKDLNKEWIMMRTSFKPFSSCKCTHTGATAIMELIKENNITAKDIAKIHADVSGLCAGIVTEPHEVKWNPKSDADAQFSLPYVLATIAFEGKFFLEEFKEAVRARRDIHELMTNITAATDTKIDTFDTRITVTLKDGRQFTKLCKYAKGSPQNPFTDEEYIEKFKLLAPYSVYKLNNETIDLVIDRILNLERVKDVVDEMILPLTPGG